jgi:hypothetical protein
MLRPLLIVISLCLLGGCQKLPHEPRFAVEFQAPGAPPTRVVVDQDSGGDSKLPLSSLVPVSPRGPHPTGWETLDLNYAEDGDQVKVTVYVLHQEYDARRHATIFRSQKLGAHSAKAQESVRVAELEKLGYIPFTLRILPAR